MALTECSECGKQVSDKASFCIQCGNPLSSTAVAPPRPTTPAQASPPPAAAPVNPEEFGRAAAAPLVASQQRKSTGGALGAVIGGGLGFMLMASSCGMPEDLLTLSMALLFYSPVILIGMLLGYFVGRAVG